MTGKISPIIEVNGFTPFCFPSPQLLVTKVCVCYLSSSVSSANSNESMLLAKYRLLSQSLIT